MLTESQRSVATASVSSWMIEIAAGLGMTPIAEAELPQAIEMTSGLMRHKVARLETFVAVQAIQPASALAFREDGVVTGVIGTLLLRAPTFRQLLGGAFDAVDVDLDLLSRGREAPSLGYAWGIAASNKTAGAAVMALGEAFRQGPFRPFPFYAKAVSPVGRHIALTRGGYQPLRHADDDLMVRQAAAMVAAA